MSNILIKQGYVGIFLFVILNFISMVIYPGGTIIEPETKGYSFFYNFLSNLGESTAKNGEDNIVSAYLFNSSMLILAISYFLFYVSYLRIQLKFNRNKILNFLSLSTIIISLVSFILVAVFSSDNSTFDIHVFFVKVAFRLLLIHCFIQLFIVYKSKLSKRMFTSSSIFCFMLLLFIIVMEYGPNPFLDNRSLLIQVSSQKMIVISILLYFFVQISESLSMSKKYN
ncbi:MAG: hypothetical protein CMC58_06265 [Flavobacteriaceae bacterium]|nr:hypothetical protein [Flavobacteriaceae bacterium]|tara:strand:- start:418 stop:1095 length:678 start_codon:yes stop_codon:yes gene_type:complete